MTDYIYSRVSTKDQKSDSQINELLKSHTNAIVFEEKQSGKNIIDRPVFQDLLNKVVNGDRIIVRELSRIGRNTIEVLDLFAKLEQRGVSVLIKNLQIESASATGKMVLTIMASVATMERELMLERQKLGIELAKKKGAYKGRRPDPQTVNKCKEAIQLIDKMAYSKEKAAKAAGIGVATLYRYLNKLN